MKTDVLVACTIALLAVSCTRENTAFDPTLADGGVPLISSYRDGLPAPQEDATTLPPQPHCGDGQCQPGETPATCPGDCQPCPAGATACTGKDSIRYCEGGAWKTASCQSVCAADGYHYAVRCKHAPNLNKEACICGHHAGFGELCDDVQQRCAPGLFCGIFPGAKVGFCTRYCSSPGANCTGAPPGTTASCSLESGGKHACGFVCSFAFCPKTLTCDVFTGLCKP